MPAEATFFGVDHSALTQWAQSLPYYKSDRTFDGQAVDLVVPGADGQKVQLKLVRYAAMEEELALRYPGIVTLMGHVAGKPHHLVRADITYKGFNLQVMEPGQTWYMDALEPQVTMAYKRSALVPRPWSCSLETPEVVLRTSNTNIITENTLKKFRLALACTGEYGIFHGGNKPSILSAMVTSMNRVNGIYERDMGVRMILIANNDDLIFTNPATDGFSNNNGSAMLNENQTIVDNIIGDANYDIGHVFSTGGGGIAWLGGVCSSGLKARGVTGQPAPQGDGFDVDYVAHEMGHQFGANHTQNNNCNRNSSSAYEPGSASTIMGYAGICSPNVQNNSDDYFHLYSLIEIQNTLNGKNCYTVESNTNTAPTIVFPNNGKVIPKGTPFRLVATATDAQGDSLTYCFEQFDLGPPVSDLNNPTGNGPAYRSIDPDTDPFRSLPRLQKVLAGNTGPPVAEPLINFGRPFSFRVAVRDHHPGGSGVSWSSIGITMHNTNGPFQVTAPVFNQVLLTNQWFELKWDVAGTNTAPINSDSLIVLLSKDDGNSFFTLTPLVQNNGSWWFQMPAGSETPAARIMLQSADNIFYNVSRKFIIQTGTVGLNEGSLTNLYLYPNPSAASVTLSGVLQGSEVQVYNMTGQLLHQEVIQNDGAVILESTNWPAGIYVVKVVHDTGQKTLQWVKQ
jgi:hypothetical protein